MISWWGMEQQNRNHPCWSDYQLLSQVLIPELLELGKEERKYVLKVSLIYKYVKNYSYEKSYITRVRYVKLEEIFSFSSKP